MHKLSQSKTADLEWVMYLSNSTLLQPDISIIPVIFQFKPANWLLFRVYSHTVDQAGT